MHGEYNGSQVEGVLVVEELVNGSGDTGDATLDLVHDASVEDIHGVLSDMSLVEILSGHE